MLREANCFEGAVHIASLAARACRFERTREVDPQARRFSLSPRPKVVCERVHGASCRAGECIHDWHYWLVQDSSVGTDSQSTPPILAISYLIVHINYSPSHTDSFYSWHPEHIQPCTAIESIVTHSTQ